MEEMEDSRVEMVPLKTAHTLDANFRESSGLIALAEPDELDSAERGMAYPVERVEPGSTNLMPDSRPAEKPDNVGFRDGTVVMKELVSRDLARVQNDLASRESFPSGESRASFMQNDSSGRGGGLISDEDFEREFGASASGGSGQSTPKRRNGSSRRSTGNSRLENGVGAEVLRGSIIDALRANANVSPRSRNNSSNGRDIDIPFATDEVLAEVGLRPSPSRDPVVGTIFKTLFYICLWYAFSMCLTLYNKFLLGEDFGKFPAPLLMNTIHFSMQAIISSILVRFSWCGTNPSQIRMTWKDYFRRGTDLCLLLLHSRFRYYRVGPSKASAV